MSNPIPPRPDNWTFDYSTCSNVTTLDGVHHTQKDNLADLWSKFIAMSAASHRDLGPGYVDIGNRLSEHGERVLREKEGGV